MGSPKDVRQSCRGDPLGEAADIRHLGRFPLRIRPGADWVGSEGWRGVSLTRLCESVKWGQSHRWLCSGVTEGTHPTPGVAGPRGVLGVCGTECAGSEESADGSRRTASTSGTGVAGSRQPLGIVGVHGTTAGVPGASFAWAVPAPGLNMPDDWVDARSKSIRVLHCGSGRGCAGGSLANFGLSQNRMTLGAPTRTVCLNHATTTCRAGVTVTLTN